MRLTLTLGYQPRNNPNDGYKKPPKGGFFMPVINTSIEFGRYLMGTVTYLYEPNDVVWAISSGATCPTAVLKGTILRVRIIVSVGTGSPAVTTKIYYDIRLDGNLGTTEFLEADVFATLAAATTEYENRLTP